MRQLTTNFHLDEFRCKDRARTPVPKTYECNALKVATNLQKLRDYIGVPIVITGSGYRTPEHNRAVGGAPKSQHLTASAADINAKGYTPKELKAVVEKLIANGTLEFGGVGLYPNFLHVDIRPGKARW